MRHEARIGPPVCALIRRERMADNFGKGSGDVGYDRAAREESRPPSAARRDPRADPDDDDGDDGIQRVDVVVDRSGRSSIAPDDTLSNAALNLRRELAKLHQQAAAVERTIEDQRRERSDALDRIELANTRATELQQKIADAEQELTNLRRLHSTTLEDLDKVRAERDALARASEAAQGTADELARQKSETETLREAHDTALRAASKYEAELGEIRKREQAGAQKVSDVEGELNKLRERVERTTAELTQAREETSQLRGENTRLKGEVSDAHDSGARVREEADRERTTAKTESDRLQRELGEARAAVEKLGLVEGDLAASKRETDDARNEVARLERELEATRHARDVATERATMADQETDGVRRDVERLQRELAEATATASRAEAKAASEARARAVVEDSVRQLRDEVTTAFARWRTIAPSTYPAAHSSPPPTRAVPISQPFAASEPPVTRRGGMESAPPPALGPIPAPPPALREEIVELEDGWSSNPPPDGGTGPVAIPLAPPSPSLTRSVPPPVPPPRRPTIPPAVYSVPPPAGLAPSAPPAPEPGRPAEGSGLTVLSKERDDLLEQLANPDTAREAAAILRERPDWLTGRPPIELLAALTTLDYDVEAPIFELARAWEREAMCRAVVGALRDEPDAKLREHGAWLLKHLGSPTALPSLVDLVTSEDEPSAVRRWLLEAIERLAANKQVGWRDVGDLVNRLVRSDDPTLRDGVIGIVAALDRSDEKRRVLLEVLRTDDDEMVLASAVHALGSALPIELDPAVSERLLGHPSPRVQRSVVDFIERSKRATKS